MKKKTIILLSSLLVVSLFTTGCGREIPVKNGSKVAVSISGNKYTATEYYEKIKEDNISKLVDMMDKELLSKEYKTGKEEKEEIEKQISQMKKYYGANDETFKQVIKQYFGVETEDEVKDILSLEYKRKKAVEKTIKEDLKNSEIKKYYNDNIYGEIKASHILIGIEVDEGAPEEEKEKAEKDAKETVDKVLKELNDGKKFEDLAKEYSTDKATASNGGNLGYFDPSTMVEEFKDAVIKLKKNEYTKEAVKTQFGYHIILKTGEKEKPKLSEVKKEIKEKLVEEKLNSDNTVYYEALKKYRENKKLKWNDDELKKAYNDYMNKLIDSAKENS